MVSKTILFYKYIASTQQAEKIQQSEQGWFEFVAHDGTMITFGNLLHAIQKSLGLSCCNLPDGGSPFAKTTMHQKIIVDTQMRVVEARIVSGQPKYRWVVGYEQLVCKTEHCHFSCFSICSLLNVPEDAESWQHSFYDIEPLSKRE